MNTKYKIVVFAYDRFETMTTSRILEEAGLDHVVLCHSEEAKQKFIEAGTVKEGRIIATGNPVGLSYQRNSALDLLEDDEWGIFLVDDLKKVTEYEDYDSTKSNVLPINTTNTTEYGRKFRKEIPVEKFITRCEELIDVCDKYGAKQGGFTAYGNPLFRTKRLSANVMIDGRAWVIKKSQLRFAENISCIDDMFFSALNLEKFGVNIMNSWVEPDFSRYAKGGLGTKEERMPKKIEECKFLVERFPKLVTYKDKKGFPPKSHVVFRNLTKHKKRGKQ